MHIILCTIVNVLMIIQYNKTKIETKDGDGEQRCRMKFVYYQRFHSNCQKVHGIFILELETQPSHAILYKNITYKYEINSRRR